MVEKKKKIIFISNINLKEKKIATFSTTITFFNKGVFFYGFNGPNTLTLGQILFSLLFLFALKKSKVLSIPDYDQNISKKTIPLALAFSLMVVSGLSALSHINVAMFRFLKPFLFILKLFVFKQL